MAILFFSGFEIGVAQPSVGAHPFPDGRELANPTQIDTSVVRSGSGSLKAAAGSQRTVDIAWGSGTTLPVYVACYFRFSANPGTLSPVVSWELASVASLRLNTDGRVGFYNSSFALVGSQSDVLAANTWHRLDMKMSNSGNTTLVSGKVNGTTLCDSQVANAAASSTFSLLRLAPSSLASTDLWFDDLIIDDANWVTASAYNVVLLLPASDYSNPSTLFTGGAGGTTSLYDAVNNVPPIGTASETNLTQIESAASSGGAAYATTTGTYTAAGIGSSDTINAVQSWVCHGEDVSTGTKTGGFGLYTNPQGDGWVGNGKAFTYGGDSGALGTYPTNWRWTGDTIVENPTITKSSGAQIIVRKTDTGTRVASCCFMGAYVAYVPATGSTYDVSVTETTSASDSPERALIISPSASEAASASDATTVLVVFSTSAAEAATGADSISAALAAVASASESASATESQTGDLAGNTHDVSATESGTAQDAPSAARTTSASASETTSPSDSATAQAAFVATATETATAADAPTVIAAMGVSTTETATATATESSSPGGQTTVSVDEPTTASDSQSVTQAAVASVSETAAAADSASTTAVRPASVTETATASDSASSGAVRPVSATEPTTATDSTSSAAVRAVSASETTSPADSTSVTAARVASASEAGSATDSPTVIASMGVSATEAASASDAVSYSGQITSASATETTTPADSVAAASQRAAAASETATATDATSSTRAGAVVVVEAAVAVDSPAAAAQLVALLVEPAAPVDFLAAEKIGDLTGNLLESASADDAVVVTFLGQIVFTRPPMTASVTGRPRQGAVLLGGARQTTLKERQVPVLLRKPDRDIGNILKD